MPAGRAGIPSRALVGAAGVLALALMAAPALLAAPAGPASAHGAPVTPLSRTLACAPDGPHVDSEACRAALAASGRSSFDDWDYLRVPGVAGRDREEVPDGELCSGGLDGFAGLDLPREDWPVTELAAGDEVTFTYRTTIPHQGTFRLYLTRDGYDPAQPLTWSDLEEEPFLSVTDPELVGDAYQLPGEIPGGRSGRHLVFTVWQNSDTPDTYYSCSDVVIEAPASPAPADDPEPAGWGAPADPAAAGEAAPAPAPPAAAVALIVAGIAAVVLAIVLTTVAVLRQRRRRARRGVHRR